MDFLSKSTRKYKSLIIIYYSEQTNIMLTYNRLVRLALIFSRLIC